MLNVGIMRFNQSQSSTPGKPTNCGLVLKYFLSETIYAQENGSRGTHFAKFLISNFLKGLTYSALYHITGSIEKWIWWYSYSRFFWVVVWRKSGSHNISVGEGWVAPCRVRDKTNISCVNNSFSGNVSSSSSFHIYALRSISLIERQTHIKSAKNSFSGNVSFSSS